MRKITLLLLTLLLLRDLAAAVPFERPKPGHPRLLMTEADRARIQADIRSGSTWARLHEDILDECDRIVGLPVLERKQIGRRLLATSREALRRIFFLSYAYRMTGEGTYLSRAEAELLAVCRFTDWNPSHYLDVAEMLAGVSIGYDWLYHQLTDSTRTLVRRAIIEKGIRPSTDSKYNWWLEAENNWNQVCNAGVTLGALAVYEEEPFRFQRIIDRGIVSVRLPMKAYDPDGAYPEGYSYWEYGTTFNVLMLSALEEVFGSDFGLSSMPGFARTADYYLHMVGPTGRSFNYADCEHENGLSPAMFYFAQRAGDPSLLWLEQHFLGTGYRANYLANRVLPAVMVWGSGTKPGHLPAPSALCWSGGGVTPVAALRTSWNDPQALYVGLKGGTAASNHAHMDAGSFVMEADGVRWAVDFGREDYERLESAGLRIWSNAQQSERWQVFRYNNFAHNTLSVDDSLHRADGYAPLPGIADEDGFQAAIVDLSSVLAGGLQAARRGVAIVHKQYVVVRDEVAALPGKPARVRWNMLTEAEVTVKGRDRIELRQDGKRLEMRIDCTCPFDIKTWSTQPLHAYDSPNPGTRFAGFEATVPAGQQAVLTVYLLPQGARPGQDDIKPLAEWNANHRTDAHAAWPGK